MTDGTWVITLLVMACSPSDRCSEAKYEFYGSEKADLKAICNQMFAEKVKSTPSYSFKYLSCDAKGQMVDEQVVKALPDPIIEQKPLSKEQEADKEALITYDKVFSECKERKIAETQCDEYANEAGKDVFNKVLDAR